MHCPTCDDFLPHNRARDRGCTPVPRCPGTRAGGGVMVRRSSVAGLDGGTESAVYGEESSTTRGRNGPAAKTPWRGGGGRWTVWPVRVVLWVAILVIGYRGIMAIVLNETPTSTGSAT